VGVRDRMAVSVGAQAGMNGSFSRTNASAGLDETTLHKSISGVDLAFAIRPATNDGCATGFL